MFFDPMYFLFILPGLGLSLWASARVKRAFNRYSKVRSRRGFTGAQAAAALLRGAGITDVQIVRAHGVLSDHYNPVTKKLTLSEPVCLCVGFHRRCRRGHARSGGMLSSTRAALAALGARANGLHRLEPRLWRHGHRLVLGLDEPGTARRGADLAP